MDTKKETVTPADLTAVDETARALARAARAMGVACIGIDVFADEVVYVNATARGKVVWRADTHCGVEERLGEERLSAALARRLGVDPVPPQQPITPLLTALEQQVLRLIGDGRMAWSGVTTDAVKRLVGKGYVVALGVAIPELTDAGRAYLAGAAATPSGGKEKR